MRPAYATKRGRMTDDEKKELERIVARMKKPTSGKVARLMNRHPATVNWYMLSRGLIERVPSHAPKPYMRNGAMVHPYAEPHDKLLLELRAVKPGQKRPMSYREIGEVLTREFGIERDAHSVQVRMVQLAAAPDADSGAA